MSNFDLEKLNSTGLLGKIYDDLAQPSVQKVGKALGTVFELSNILVSPIWMLNEYAGLKKDVFKKNMERVREKIDKIPEEDVCEVLPEIGVPIVEKLTYITNTSIREAFTNLLVKVSSSETALFVHPAFIKVIESLSIDEVKIIEYLKDKKEIPFLTYKINVKNPSGFLIEKRYATGIEFEIELDYPQNISLYLQNLGNIGVIANNVGEYKLNFDLYYTPIKDKYADYEKEIQGKFDSIKNVEIFDSLPEETKETIDRFTDWSVDKGYFSITDFGIQFIKACNDS